MKIKKIFLGLLAATFLFNFFGQSYAVMSMGITDRCDMLVSIYDIYERKYEGYHGWQDYAVRRRELTDQILDDLCRRKDEFELQPIRQVKDMVIRRLSQGVRNPMVVYDISSVDCAQDYLELVYNLTMVYLTYIDIMDKNLIMESIRLARCSENIMELLCPKKHHLKLRLGRNWACDLRRATEEIKKRIE